MESLQIKEKFERYNFLCQFLDNNNHKEFYLNLSKDELEYLG